MPYDYIVVVIVIVNVIISLIFSYNFLATRKIVVVIIILLIFYKNCLHRVIRKIVERESVEAAPSRGSRIG